MKIRPVFDFRSGLFWDRHRRILSFFPLPMLGLCFELGGGAVVKELPAGADDDAVLLEAVGRYPTATWPQLKAALGGMGATRATLARERLLKAGKLAVVVKGLPDGSSRRVLGFSA